jgi:hypothetical protein
VIATSKKPEMGVLTDIMVARWSWLAENPTKILTAGLWGRQKEWGKLGASHDLHKEQDPN